MKDTIARVHITLLDCDPPIWRRIEVPADFTLKRLHDAIQLAMGWYDYHLHHFEIGGVLYGQRTADDGFEDREIVSETRIRLGVLLEEGTRTFDYAYDYGDDWHLAVVLESFAPAHAGAIYPRLVDGARAGAPEDSGGPWGYAEVLEAIADPDHERHEEITEWIGDAFDPERFDKAEINAALAKLASKKITRRKSAPHASSNGASS